MANIIAFSNGYLCLRGKLVESTLFIDQTTGLIVSEPHDQPAEVVDLKGGILAPAYIELQTNGCVGLHFTHYKDPLTYQSNLKKVSRYMITKGVGGFWATVPTVSSDVFQKVRVHSLAVLLSTPLHFSFLGL